jgi:hypothetical protein
LGTFTPEKVTEMSDLLAQVLPNGHLVMPPEFRDLVRRAKVFTVTEQDGCLLLTPVGLPEVARQEDLLSPVLEQQATQRREKISRWQAARHPTEESKARVLNLAGLVSEEGVPSDVSGNFRDHLYGTEA